MSELEKMRSKFQRNLILFISLYLVLEGVFLLLEVESFSSVFLIILGIIPIVIAIIGGMILLGTVNKLSAVWYWLEAIFISVHTFLSTFINIEQSYLSYIAFFIPLVILISFIVAADEVTHYKQINRNHNNY